jgi:hypothetical protein
MNTTIKFLGQATRGLARQQTPCMHIEHLGKALMLTSFLIRGARHSIG